MPKKSKPLTDDELLDIIDAKIRDDDLPGYQLAQLLAQRNALRSAARKDAEVVDDEQAPDPMVDLDELSFRRAKRAAG